MKAILLVVVAVAAYKIGQNRGFREGADTAAEVETFNLWAGVR